MLKKSVNAEATVLGTIALGCAVAITVSLLGCLTISIMINSDVLAEEKMGYAVLLVTSLSSALGAITVRRGNRRSRLLKAMLVGVTYCAILVVMSLVLFAGPGDGVGVTCLLILGSCACVSALGRDGKQTRTGHIRKYANR